MKPFREIFLAVVIMAVVFGLYAALLELTQRPDPSYHPTRIQLEEASRTP